MANNILFSVIGPDLESGGDDEVQSRVNPWYALQVRPRYERFVSEALTYKGLEEYLPLYRVRKRWSDRYKVIELPLFPGYVFCRVDWKSCGTPSVLSTPGVLRVLSMGREPTEVNERELDAVRAIVQSGRAACPWPAPQLGDLVRIEYGPLCGVEGIMVGTKKNCRLVVTVTLLQRAVSVDIEETWARPISRNHSVPGYRCVKAHSKHHSFVRNALQTSRNSDG